MGSREAPPAQSTQSGEKALQARFRSLPSFPQLRQNAAQKRTNRGGGGLSKGRLLFLCPSGLANQHPAISRAADFMCHRDPWPRSTLCWPHGNATLTCRCESRRWFPLGHCSNSCRRCRSSSAALPAARAPRGDSAHQRQRTTLPGTKALAAAPSTKSARLPSPPQEKLLRPGSLASQPVFFTPALLADRTPLSLMLSPGMVRRSFLPAAEVRAGSCSRSAFAPSKLWNKAARFSQGITRASRMNWKEGYSSGNPVRNPGIQDMKSN